MKNKRASTKETHVITKNMEVFWSVGLGALQYGVTEDPQYGMTTVDLNNLAYADEPFVLANDVAGFLCEGYVYQAEKKKR